MKLLRYILCIALVMGVASVARGADPDYFTDATIEAVNYDPLGKGLFLEVELSNDDQIIFNAERVMVYIKEGDVVMFDNLLLAISNAAWLGRKTEVTMRIKVIDPGREYTMIAFRIGLPK